LTLPHHSKFSIQYCFASGPDEALSVKICVNPRQKKLSYVCPACPMESFFGFYSIGIKFKENLFFNI